MSCGTTFTLLPQTNSCQLELEQANGIITPVNLYGASAKEVKDNSGTLQYISLKTLLGEIRINADSGITVGELQTAIGNCHQEGNPLLEDAITRQTILSAPANLVVDAFAGHLVIATMDSTNVTIDPVVNITDGTVLMRLIASGAARDINLDASIRRPDAMVLPINVPNGQAAIVSIAVFDGVQSANITVEAA